MATLTREFSARRQVPGSDERRPIGWVVQFDEKATGRRPKIRLGPVSKKVAENARRHIEHLIAARTMAASIDVETAQWVAGLSDQIHERRERVGLVAARASREPSQARQTLDGLIKQDVAARRPNLKPNTVRNLEQAGNKLVEHFGKDRPVTDITQGDAMDWREKLLAGMAEAAAATHIAKAKQFFSYALAHRIIAEDPFAAVKKGSQKNRHRLRFVTREEIAKLLAVCPDNEWRLIVVLARYGGLRTPSEMQELKWTDVLWDQNKILITVQKKQHLEGHETRFVPIFPEIRPSLQAAWDEAEEGARYVVPRATRPGVNLGTQMRRLIEQAGLQAWPRTFQNLRASCDTELANEYPLYLVNAWIGHTSRVAQDHYQMVTDEDFLRAGQGTAPALSAELRRNPHHESLPTRAFVPVHIPVQTGAIRGSQEASEANKKAVSPGIPNETAFSVPSTGVQQTAFFQEYCSETPSAGADSGAEPLTADTAELVRSFDQLAPSERQLVLRLVRSMVSGDG